MPSKRHTILFFVLIFTVLAFILLSLLPNHKSSFSDLIFDSRPNLIVLSDIERFDEKGVLFIRLPDGKEQFLIGDWDVNFHNNGLYAFNKNTEEAKEEAKIMYLINNDRVHQIKLDGFSALGNVTAAYEDPTQKYVFIELSSQTETTYCIATKITEDSPNCQQVKLNKLSRAAWNKSGFIELALLTSDNSLYSYNPEENKMRFINPDKEPRNHNNLTSLFTEPNKSTINTKSGESSKFWRILNVVVTKQNGKITFHRIPLMTKGISWFTDSNHILLKEQHSISVLELSSNNLATIFGEFNVGDMKVTIQHENQSVSL